MKKLRKGTQLTLSNWKRAGRTAIHDKGIRHISREDIKKPTSLHLTIKVRENKADIKNKQILKALHHSIKRARMKRLKIVHYTLEYNHIHLLVEAEIKQLVHQGMQAFGISLAKKINTIKRLKGTVYKHRYHLRKINSPRDLKNVLHYIFNNGIHHKRTSNVLDSYNSLPALKNLNHLYGPWAKKIEADIKKSSFLSELKIELLIILDQGRVHFKALEFI
jgi:REP element-mobilizing transposase RayT